MPFNAITHVTGKRILPENILMPMEPDNIYYTRQQVVVVFGVFSF